MYASTYLENGVLNTCAERHSTLRQLYILLSTFQTPVRPEAERKSATQDINVGR